MKIAPRQIVNTLKQPSSDILVWLCYGNDQGKVMEYGSVLCEKLRAGDQDDLNFTNFSGKELKEDPALFFTETSAISMFGGNKVIRIYDAKDSYGIAALIKDYLNRPQPVGIVIEAGSLEKSSALRKLFENAKEKKLAAIACYLDERQDLNNMVSTIIRENNLQITKDAFMTLMTKLGGDRAISRLEVEKLCLYKGQGEITLEDVEATLEDTSNVNMQAVINSCLLGEFDLLEKNLTRLWLENIQPIALLRAISRQFLRLQEAVAYRQQGLDNKSIMYKLSPPVFFKEEAAFLAQMNRWSMDKIHQALQRAKQAETQCMDHARLGESITHRLFLSIASISRKKL